MSTLKASLIQLALTPLIGVLIVIALGNKDRVSIFLITYYIIFILVNLVKNFIERK